MSNLHHTCMAWKGFFEFEPSVLYCNKSTIDIIHVEWAYHAFLQKIKSWRTILRIANPQNPRRQYLQDWSSRSGHLYLNISWFTGLSCMSWPAGRVVNMLDLQSKRVGERVRSQPGHIQKLVNTKCLSVETKTVVPCTRFPPTYITNHPILPIELMSWLRFSSQFNIFWHPTCPSVYARASKNPTQVDRSL
jgi:hypothetical protein